MKDQLYKKKISKIKEFNFNQKVSDVFEDMIFRSVPEYDLYIDDCANIASWHFNTLFRNKKSHQDHISNPYIIYDLGCSTLNTTLAIGTALRNKPIKINAVDNSKAMIKKAKKKLKECPAYTKKIFLSLIKMSKN